MVESEEMEKMKYVWLTWSNSLRSGNTYRAYINSVDLYCNMVFGKKPVEITQDDLGRLRFSTTLNKFVKPLRDRHIKDSTIKSHLTAVRSFVKAIRREKLFPDLDFTAVVSDALSSSMLVTRDVEHHEAISLKELKSMEKWLKEKKFSSNLDQELGAKYAMLIDFMYKTAIRITATMSITWEDFTLQNSPYGGDWAILQVIDKGKKLNKKYLTQKYYYELKELFYNGDDSEEVFGELSPHTLRNYFKEYNKMTGQHFVIHSLKAGAATSLYAMTKDLLLVRDFCDHESVKTTEAYIHAQKDPHTSGTAILTANYDSSKLNDLSKEDLLMLIHSRPEIEGSVCAVASQLGKI